MSHEVAKYQCETCGQSYLTQASLNAHQHEHTDTHRCNMCGHSYSRDEWGACPYCDPEVDL